MSPVVLTILRTIGTVLGSMLMSLLTGKTLKDLLIRPIEWIRTRVRTKEADKIVADIRQDWGLPPDPVEIRTEDVVSSAEPDELHRSKEGGS